jgi:serine/threonine protein kinase
MAAWKRSGRASDIFSLGCVLLEIVILHEQGTLRHVRLNRSADPAFHANLDRVNAWFSGPLAKPPSTRRAHLVSEITSMLARNHEVRPVAKELLIRVTGYDLAQTVPSKYSLFGDCCRGHFMSSRQMKRHTDTITRMDSDLQRAHDELAEKKKQMIRVTEEHAISAPWLHEGQAGSGTGSTGKHTDTLERDTSTLRSECIECISRWLEKDQASPEELIKMLSSKTQRNAINTTDAKMSTPEWQLEKKKLEQRIAERTEAPGGYFESLQYSLLHPTRTSHRESAAPPPTQGLQGISSPLPAVLVMSQDNPKPRKMLAHHRELEEPPLDSESEYDMERRRRRRARKEARSREIMGLE